jgi:hypothetical protein
LADIITNILAVRTLKDFLRFLSKGFSCGINMSAAVSMILVATEKALKLGLLVMTNRKVNLGFENGYLKNILKLQEV